MSEGEALLNRKPSILTPDAPEFVPRWMQPGGDAPATAPVIGEGPKNSRSRSFAAGYMQPNHFPPHSNPMAGNFACCTYLDEEKLIPTD